MSHSDAILGAASTPAEPLSSGSTQTIGRYPATQCSPQGRAMLETTSACALGDQEIARLPCPLPLADEQGLHAAGASALKENVQPSNGVHRTPDSNGHSKGADTEPRILAEVAETSLVRDVLCACQVYPCTNTAVIQLQSSYAAKLAFGSFGWTSLLRDMLCTCLQMLQCLLLHTL